MLNDPSKTSAMLTGQTNAAFTALTSGNIDDSLNVLTSLGALLNTVSGAAASPAGHRRRLLISSSSNNVGGNNSSSDALPGAAQAERARAREGLLGILSSATAIVQPTVQSLAQIAQTASSVGGVPEELTAAGQVGPSTPTLVCTKVPQNS